MTVLGNLFLNFIENLYISHKNWPFGFKLQFELKRNV